MQTNIVVEKYNAIPGAWKLLILMILIIVGSLIFWGLIGGGGALLYFTKIKDWIMGIIKPKTPEEKAAEEAAKKAAEEAARKAAEEAARKAAEEAARKEAEAKTTNTDTSTFMTQRSRFARRY